MSLHAEIWFCIERQIINRDNTIQIDITRKITGHTQLGGYEIEVRGGNNAISVGEGCTKILIPASSPAPIAAHQSGVESRKEDAQIPTVYSLAQNHPNPFNPTTRIQFGLPEASDVRLSIFNILGQEVATIISEAVPAGYRTVEWNSTNSSGNALPSGVYIYRLKATSLTNGTQFQDVRKMLLMK